MRKIFSTLILLALFAEFGPLMAQESLVGTKLPEWQVSDWVNSDPLMLEDLKGHPVLIRFFTGTTCPYCSATAPVLSTFHELYGDQGLVVVGIYHHKSWFPFFNKKYVLNLVERYGFKFPVAVDHNWRTLRSWWLETGEREMTSVSFLLDEDGMVRYVHPGGQLSQGDPDNLSMNRAIRATLHERLSHEAESS